MDRRADPRVEVRLRCHVEVPANKSYRFVGVTENMSRSGILMAWNGDGGSGDAPKPGDLLSVDIELPANHSFGRRCMHCQTVVARVTPEGRDRVMVAMQVTQIQFRSYQNGSHSCIASQDELRCSVM